MSGVCAPFSGTLVVADRRHGSCCGTVCPTASRGAPLSLLLSVCALALRCEVRRLLRPHPDLALSVVGRTVSRIPLEGQIGIPLLPGQDPTGVEATWSSPVMLAAGLAAWLSDRRTLLATTYRLQLHEAVNTSMPVDLVEPTGLVAMVAEDGVELAAVINKLSIAEYRRLAKEGYNFNALKKQKIARYESLKGTDLSSWAGKSTEELIESIFEKLNVLKIKFPHVAENGKYRWRVRVDNIRKRIWLLLRHVG